MTLDELVHCASSDKRYYEGLALKVLEGYRPAPSPNELKTQLEEAFQDGLEEGQSRKYRAVKNQLVWLKKLALFLSFL